MTTTGTTRRRWRSVLDWPVRIALAAVVSLGNICGAGVVLVLSVWVIPTGPLAEPGRVVLLNVLAFGAYLLFSVPVGVIWGSLRFRVRNTQGLDDDEAALLRQRRIVLYGPLRLVTVQSVLWLVGAVGFAGLNALFSPRLALAVGSTVLLGGITTCAVSYLMSERILRRTAARVLAGESLRAGGCPGSRCGPCCSGRWGPRCRCSECWWRPRPRSCRATCRSDSRR